MMFDGDVEFGRRACDEPRVAASAQQTCPRVARRDFRVSGQPGSPVDPDHVNNTVSPGVVSRGVSWWADASRMHACTHAPRSGRKDRGITQRRVRRKHQRRRARAGAPSLCNNYGRTKPTTRRPSRGGNERAEKAHAQTRVSRRMRRGIRAYAALVVPIICVAAQKGGVGKSTIAYELAAALSGVLVDLDYDAGGVTEGIWGYPSARFQRSPLLDALERGPGHPMPQAKVAPRRPALIPSHRDLSPDASAIPPDLVTECLTAWAASCAHSCLVVDTHPGGGALAAGAQRAANLVVAPSVLARLEINALAAMVAGYASYPLLVVPNRVPPRPSGVWVERLASAAGDVPVSPLISDHPWLPQRLRRAAITLEPNPGRRVKAAAAEFGAVADTAWGYANA